MRLVATSDTHFFVDPSIIPPGDVFVHGGDLMDRGYESEWNDLLSWLEALPHEKKYLVPGNHDFHLVNYPGPALQDLKWVGVEVIGHPLSRKKVTLPNDMIMIGSPWVTELKRWAYNSDEKTIHEYMMSLGPADVVISHSPIYGSLDEVVVSTKKQFTEAGLVEESQYKNTGIKAYEVYRKRFNPKVWIHGHIHEDYGHVKVDNTDIFNVCLCDINYKHRNPPLVLEL